MTLGMGHQVIQTVGKTYFPISYYFITTERIVTVNFFIREFFVLILSSFYKYGFNNKCKDRDFETDVTRWLTIYYSD